MAPVVIRSLFGRETCFPSLRKFHVIILVLQKVLARQGQAQRADAHFKMAIELNPNLPFCVLNTCM
jgi:hypothetical protein